VFCASKNYLYFITVNSKAVEVLLILLLLFSKVLEPNTCFVLKMDSAVGDGFTSPSQPHEQRHSVALTSEVLQLATVVTKAPWPLRD
jgi:hypothetical protein